MRSEKTILTDQFGHTVKIVIPPWTFAKISVEMRMLDEEECQNLFPNFGEHGENEKHNSNRTSLNAPAEEKTLTRQHTT
jgi:hypothetical protein